MPASGGSRLPATASENQQTAEDGADAERQGANEMHPEPLPASVVYGLDKHGGKNERQRQHNEAGRAQEDHENPDDSSEGAAETSPELGAHCFFGERVSENQEPSDGHRDAEQRSHFPSSHYQPTNDSSDSLKPDCC